MTKKLVKYSVAFADGPIPFRRLVCRDASDDASITVAALYHLINSEDLMLLDVDVVRIDAFTDTAFKGNPAAVCWLEGVDKHDKWLQSVAAEFNISETCYLTPVADHKSENPRFGLRWFTPVAEVELCGHATLAASHFLYESGLVNSDTIEFSTLSGILTAKKVPDSKIKDSSNGDTQDSFYIELNFPVVPVSDYSDLKVSAISEILNGVSVVDVKKNGSDDLFVRVKVVLPSAKDIVEFKPQINQIKEAPARGIIITALAPEGSGFDFYSRFFCPKYGIDEDPVCGSAHCALAAYWHEKLGKSDFVAYQASPRSGTVYVHLDEKNQRVLLRGKATTVMEGSLLV
ncbi:phenazine biosynthesis PhzC/PhzF protein [Tanacetum coccineum]